MMARFCFLIRNHGKLYLPNWSLSSLLSLKYRAKCGKTSFRKRQSSASICSPVLYEIIAGRYEKGATVITSNKSLATWGDLVGDSALMMASIDRLLHHGEVFYLRGSSYRMRGKEAVTLNVKGEGVFATEKA